MKIEKILFPTDFMEGCKEAVSYAVDLARKYNASLHIIHVIHDVTQATGLYVPHVAVNELFKSMEEEANKQIKRDYLEETRGLENITYKVLRGIPYEEIIKYAKQEGIDLIVMASHARKGLDRLFFGSTAEKVVKNAECAVLTVKAQ